MNISKPFIERPIMTLLVMLSILFFGIFAYVSLPVSDLPNVDMPTIEVTVSYPGANPETMANSIATPLEQQFMTIQSIESVLSSSNTGKTSILLTFALDRDIDAAATDVQQAITTAMPQLPSNLPNNPTYQKVNPAVTPILYIALVNPNMTEGTLYDYGNTFLGNRISMVEGVSQVIPYGSPYAARIQVDPEKLAAKNIGIDEVADLLRQQNVDLPLGTLWGKRDDFTIDADGQLLDAAGYSEIILKQENGTLVKIADVGRALDSVQNDKFFLKYFTKKGEYPTFILGIQKLPGANTVQVVTRINALLDELRGELPDTLQIFRIYDQSLTILEGIDEVEMTLCIAFVLVVCIIFVLLGKIQNTLIPSLALPLCIAGTAVVMLLLGFSLDILSLLAITLSIGFLVDDAIVVLENTVRHVQEGAAPFPAAIASAKEISTTVLSMTLCLSAAFLPLLFMEGVVGRLFREFSSTIIIAVLFSGFISLSLTPMLASRFLKPYALQKKPKMEKIAENLNEKLLRYYDPCLRFAMRHKILVLGIGFCSVLGSLALAYLLPKDFLPPDDVGFIQGYTLARDGTSPYLMLQYHDEIGRIAIEDPNVDEVISMSSFTNPNEGILFFRLLPFSQRLSMYAAIDELSKKFASLPGVLTFLSPLPLIDLAVGSTAQALYQYALVSLDTKSLYNYVPTLLQAMRESPEFTQVSSDLRIHQPQWSFHIDREKASNYHVNASQIENLFQYAYSNNKISQINGEINTYDVLLETLPAFYQDPSALSALYVRSSTNHLVPLAELVSIEQTVGPLTRNHLNGLSSASISFNPAPNVPLGDALSRLHTLTANMPQKIHGQLLGTAQVFQASFRSLPLLLLLAFFVIYVLLGILYENLFHPLTVMSALPPALFGGLLTLYLFRETLSIYSFVGLILLMGIVLKNGIMMVDFANDSIQKGEKDHEKAISHAARIRFRPILMTTIAALMGAVPIALGIGGGMAQTRRSLGLCIVGGLVISQLLTLLLTPVLFSLFQKLQDFITKDS